MITPEQEAEILRLFHVERWPPGTIARQLGVHHSAVTRVVSQEEKPPERKRRSSIVDPYLPFILEMLEKFPRLPARRLFDMVRERGYPGASGHFRSIVARYRPRPSGEAYLRLRTLPGEQCQVDWGHFGRLEVKRASRPLMAFVMVLSYSRAIFLRFFLSQSLSNFLRGHEAAFNFFGGTSRAALYDNLKSAVLERVGMAIRFNPQFLEFAAHYRFDPRPVAVARGNEKGRVERAIRFVRTSFFPGRRYKDLGDLNRQAYSWCQTRALERRWPEDKRLSVAEVFRGEKEKLLPLPDEPYPSEERVEVNVGKSPYVRFDLNDYSVPHDFARKTVVVSATEDTVRILSGAEVIAKHARSYDRGEQVEDPVHIKHLAEAKSDARRHRGVDRLRYIVPESAKILAAVAERGQPLARAVAQLTDLLDTYGKRALSDAIEEALRGDAAHPQAVQHILERNRRREGRRPPRALPLPDDPRIRGLSVRPHDLGGYDRLEEEEEKRDVEGQS